jgi:hypothetical protein
LDKEALHPLELITLNIHFTFTSITITKIVCL